MLQRCLRQSSRALSASAFEPQLSHSSRASILSRRVGAPLVNRSFTTTQWRKAEAEAQAEKAAENPSEEKPQTQTEAENPLQKELDAKAKEVVDVTDKWKRTIADYRNLQEQTKREVKAARDFGLQKFAKDLTESVDNLDRALGTVPQEALTDANKDLKTLYDGLRMTERILLQTLKRHGLERFDPSETSEKFDPNKHEATFQVPQPDKEDGTVFHTQQKGFMLNGRVLRAAQVGVVKNS